MVAVIVSTSLWGADPKYCAGAIRVIRRLPEWAQLWVYHDRTVPEATLARLESLGAILIDASALGWRGERRAMWRFMALDDAPAVYLMDTDVTPELLTHPRTAAALAALRDTPVAPGRPRVWTWRPWWRHQGEACIPACFTGIAVAAPLGGRMRQALERYVRDRAPLEWRDGSIPAKRPRYPDGYGLDEWFLRFHLRRVLGEQPRYTFQ